MVRFTDHLFPVVVFQAMGECGPADIEFAEKAYRAVFTREQRLVSVSDARRSANHAAQRKLWADLTERLETESARWTMATVIILDSAALRAALTAVNWITPPNIPQHIVKSPLEVAPALRSLAVKYGLTLPPAFDAPLQAWLAEGVSLYESDRSAARQTR
jgi:hypothetical protein